MMTQADYRREELANEQLKATRDVLHELQGLAGVDEPPQEYYWFRYADYVQMDRYGNFECWSSGCRGQPDERCSYSFELDESVIKVTPGEIYDDGSREDDIYEHDISAFKAALRARLLPKFNQLRAAKRASIEASIKSSQAKLITLQGDIQ